MKIQFKKYKNKPSTLSCTRDDGSVTWTKIHPGFEVHDIAHFAIETTLGFESAFFGLLKSGHDIGDFEIPREKRPDALLPKNLPLESLQTEHMVNLLLTEQLQTSRHEEYIETLRAILEEHHLEYPKDLTPQALSKIRKEFNTLHSQWEEINPDGELQLWF